MPDTKQEEDILEHAHPIIEKKCPLLIGINLKESIKLWREQTEISKVREEDFGSFDWCDE